MVKPEKIDHLHLVYHFTVPLILQGYKQQTHSEDKTIYKFH